VGGITNWKQLSAGNYSHSLGLTDDGILYAWGGNFGGCLGIGEAPGTFRSSPVTVIGGITNWSSVDGGRDVTLGLTDDGIAYVWGSGNYGLLGTDDLDRRSSPVTVIGGITNWTQVSIGQHALGIGDR
jgi:alpha-tubulin suppressor-like RCC1 family protein